MHGGDRGPDGSADGVAARVARAAGELLEEGGPAAVTMREVGARAGVSAMASYRHYPNREALLGHLVATAFAELAGRFDGAAPAGPDAGPVEESVEASVEESGEEPDGEPGEAGVETALFAMLDHVLDLAMSRPNLYALVFTDRRPGARVLPDQAEESPTLARVIGALRRGMAAGVLRPDDPAEVAVTAAGLVQGLWLARHAGRIDLPDDEFRAFCHRAARRLIDGLRS